MWLDRDYSIDIDWAVTQGQDTNGRLEIWVYYGGNCLTQIDNVEQLEAMYYGVYGKSIHEK